jgi:predicted O-linked N-acetylglucosamine transferase (SPINDLY family)
LWLLDGSEAVNTNLRKEAAARGVDPDRLIFARPLSAAEHLARQSLADLFLDTWPWGGHTMASDALWSGVPVLTMPGANFASRVGASLLTAVGLPELICASREAYVATAVALAQDPLRARALRQRLGANRLVSPLFDISRFCCDIENTYKEMATRQRRGERPQSFIAPN